MLWLPATVALFVMACRWRPGVAPWVLVAASFLFCMTAGPRSLVFLVLSVLGNFIAMVAIRRMTPASPARSLVVGVAILANLAPLVGYKVAQQVVPVAMPLGLAFYTLQQITFLIEGQKEDAPRLNLLRFAAWGSFFAQLPAGPIGAYRRMAPQFEKLGLTAPATADIARGVALVLAGVVKKTWLADPMARKVDAVLTAADLGAVTPLEAWTAAWGFMLQLYFDFSAYSDIAIGVGLCFGLALPINFDSPLKAVTPGQYVMRWHMSLMTFVREHVFEPVFRLARRLPVTPTSRRYGIAWAVATLVAYLVVAAWHTAAPLPLAQGFCVAVLIVLLQFLRQRVRETPRVPTSAEVVARRVAGHALILLGVAVIALLLRADGGQLGRLAPALADIRGGMHLLNNLTAAVFSGVETAAPALYPNARLPGVRTLGILVVVTTIALACPNTMQIFGIPGVGAPAERLRWRPTLVWGALTVVLLALTLIGITRPVEQYGFIYGRF